MKEYEPLEKSVENEENRDSIINEINNKANSISGIVSLVLAFILYLFQILAGGQENFALYAVVLSYQATSYLVKAIYTKETKYKLISFILIIFVIFFSIIHIKNF